MEKDTDEDEKIVLAITNLEEEYQSFEFFSMMIFLIGLIFAICVITSLMCMMKKIRSKMLSRSIQPQENSPANAREAITTFRARRNMEMGKRNSRYTDMEEGNYYA